MVSAKKNDKIRKVIVYETNSFDFINVFGVLLIYLSTVENVTDFAQATA